VVGRKVVQTEGKADSEVEGRTERAVKKEGSWETAAVQLEMTVLREEDEEGTQTSYHTI
jgi:hypothetical protein